MLQEWNYQPVMTTEFMVIIHRVKVVALFDT